MMAVEKKKKGMSRKELKAPDEVATKLWSLSEWVEERWKPLLIGIGSVVAVWAIIGIVQEMRASSRRATAKASEELFATLAARVKSPDDAALEASGAPQPAKTFETDKAKADAAVAAAEAFAGRVSGEAAELAKLLAASLKGTKGEFEPALAAVDAYLAKHADDPMALPLLEQKATALAALGKSAEAEAAYKALAEKAPATGLKALALKSVGDLYNPKSGTKTPDAAKAKEAYKAALALAKPGEDVPPAGTLRYVFVDVSAKLAQID
jgi:tetratricopeptide (TPR) repeat protein